MLSRPSTNAARPRYLHLVIILLLVRPAFAQQELNVPTPRYVPTRWGAVWLTHPDLSGGEDAVVLFRKTLNLPQKPDRFILNVSADNKYTLYVNGKRVCFGPQLSDIRHWRYETVDIAPFMQPGRNVLAAEVVNFGPDRFFGMHSARTAFLLNGLEASPAAVGAPLASTQPRNDWRVLLNPGLKHRPVRWRVRPEDRDIIGGFYAANPTDSLRADAYPWGWEAPEYDDSRWKRAAYAENASAFGGGFAWLLEPRNVPLQTSQTERIAGVARTEGVLATSAFLSGNQPLTIPANTSATILLDHKKLTIGYPELTFSGGKNALVKVGYAENLFLPNGDKGNRNDLTNKRFVGMKDVIVADGQRRTFRPTWIRAFRFVQLEVQTSSEPLTINDFVNVYTKTAIPVKARFMTDNAEWNNVFDLCRRTIELCTQDYFLSDAYYETMQYLGDSKVHNLSWLSLSGNDAHVRNALDQFNHSRLWDGNLTSCYPLKSTFVHPTYSVIWVDMLYDYLQWSGDKAFIQPYLPAIRHTLDGFDLLIQPNGLAGKTRWDYFIDWYVDSRRGGLAKDQDGSNSAVVTLHYVQALQNAARLHTLFGDQNQAQIYQKRATDIRQKVMAQCFDARRGLVSERPLSAQTGTPFFDQHTNIMAILTDALPADQFRPVLQKILTDTTISPATYYYRHYLFEAIRKAKASDWFANAQEPWIRLVRDGLTTALERFDSPVQPTRSECHPWSTAPAWAYFGIVAGIQPQGIGGAQIRIEPGLGELKWVEGVYPHRLGEMPFRFERVGTGLTGFVTLPAGTTGTFVWQGKTIALKPGQNSVRF